MTTCQRCGHRYFTQLTGGTCLVCGARAAGSGGGAAGPLAATLHDGAADADPAGAVDAVVAGPSGCPFVSARATDA